LGFAGISVLACLGATDRIDRWVLNLANSIALYPLDVAGSIASLAGDFEITGAVALALSLLWGSREGLPGLTPLLLFVGVAIEAVLKHFLPHPGPPHARGLQLLPLFHLHHYAAHWLPYSFPSGHMLRTVFLAELIGRHKKSWLRIGWVLVGVMAFTRVYLNVHWTSDVAGGLLLGLALAAATQAFPVGKSGCPVKEADPHRCDGSSLHTGKVEHEKGMSMNVFPSVRSPRTPTS
jgi:membrane-associated phospholipid phosphatase